MGRLDDDVYGRLDDDELEHGQQKEKDARFRFRCRPSEGRQTQLMEFLEAGRLFKHTLHFPGPGNTLLVHGASAPIAAADIRLFSEQLDSSA
jgi:hypothetical protein